jgi:hypothetical protein
VARKRGRTLSACDLTVNGRTLAYNRRTRPHNRVTSRGGQRALTNLPYCGKVVSRSGHENFYRARLNYLGAMQHDIDANGIIRKDNQAVFGFLQDAGV